MDHSLFASVIHHLLHMNVTRPYADEDAYHCFEDKYCYNAILQPMFVGETLARLVESMEDRVFYESRGLLGVCIVFFRLDGEPFVVGPFVRTEFDSGKARSVLVANHMPAAMEASIKLYYSAFPLAGVAQVRNTLLSCIQAFSGFSEDYLICRLENAGKLTALPRIDYSESFDYTAVYRRYELENAFLRTVTSGDVENVLSAFNQMNLEGMSKNRYVSAIYQDPVIGLSMLRVLARKAAERGGATVVEVNEITQRAAQKLITLHSTEEQVNVTQKMILELTEAVQRHKQLLGTYSPSILRVTEYLRLNYSQKISLPSLARLAAFSEDHLTRTFKKEVGLTISQYIAHLRCMQAAELLAGSSISVQEISEYVGYPDNNYFVKVFRKQYGMTPSEYRTSHQ